MYIAFPKECLKFSGLPGSWKANPDKLKPMVFCSTGKLFFSLACFLLIALSGNLGQQGSKMKE